MVPTQNGEHVVLVKRIVWCHPNNKDVTISLKCKEGEDSEDQLTWRLELEQVKKGQKVGIEKALPQGELVFKKDPGAFLENIETTLSSYRKEIHNIIQQAR
jgi:hypothetical protein